MFKISSTGSFSAQITIITLEYIVHTEGNLSIADLYWKFMFFLFFSLKKKGYSQQNIIDLMC